MHRRWSQARYRGRRAMASFLLAKKKNTKDIKTYGADQGGWGERQHVGYVGVQPEAISGLL